MTEKSFEKVIDNLQVFMVWFLIFVVAVSILTLILFDVLVGAGVMYYLTNEHLSSALGISLATSGLLMFLMMSVVTLKDTSKSSAMWLLVLAFLVYILDIYFDSLTADILRYGQIISLKGVSEYNHHLFRALLGGISTIGEGVAVAIIFGMPVLKKILANALPKEEPKQKQHPEKKTGTQRREELEKQYRKRPKSKKSQRPSQYLSHPRL